MGTLVNSENPDEMQHNAAFHQGFHCLQRLTPSSVTEKHRNLENSTCVPFKYRMDRPILIVSVCMGKSINTYCIIMYGKIHQCLLYQYVWENPSEYKGLK